MEWEKSVVDPPGIPRPWNEGDAQARHQTFPGNLYSLENGIWDTQKHDLFSLKTRLHFSLFFNGFMDSKVGNSSFNHLFMDFNQGWIIYWFPGIWDWRNPVAGSCSTNSQGEKLRDLGNCVMGHWNSLQITLESPPIKGKGSLRGNLGMNNRVFLLKSWI